MPVYNRAHIVNRAIDSIIQQTYSNFELIIVDDCSTDNIEQVCSKVDDSRISFYKLNRNAGAAAARNYGITKSAGNIISFLDSDDFFEPSFLEVSQEKLSKTPSNIGFMWTGARFHQGSKIKEVSWLPKYNKSTYHTFLTTLRIGTGAGISFKREVFKNCGKFDVRLPAAEDTEFFLRISQKYDYTFVNEILINIVKTADDRMSGNLKNLAEAYNIFVPAHFKEIDKYEHLQKKFYYKLMWLNYHLNIKSAARQYFLKIPRSEFLFLLKSSFVLIIYEIFSLKAAKKIHMLLSK